MWFSPGFYPWCTTSDAFKFLQCESIGTYILSLSWLGNAYFEAHIVVSPGQVWQDSTSNLIHQVQTWWIRCDMPHGVYGMTGSEKSEIFFKSLSVLLHQCGANTPFVSQCLGDE